MGDGRAHERAAAAAAVAAAAAEFSYEPPTCMPVAYDPGAKWGEKMAAALALAADSC